MFFDSWSGLIRVLVVGALAYGGLVVLLRASGKRTLSKMNAFDFVVTVALGSTLATILLSKDVALAEGILAFALLIYMQFAVTWTSVRFRRIEKIVKMSPALLLFKGDYLDDALTRERVTRSEVEAAVRQQGWGSIEAVVAVVLETDGSMSVIAHGGETPGSHTSVIPLP